MINVRILGMVVAAFIAGTFAASPELRAFAANTIGSADIIDGSIQSIDIGAGQVKTADIGGSAVTSAKIAGGAVTNSDIAPSAVSNGKIATNAVTSTKIADNTIVKADVSPSFMKFVQLLDDATGNAAGWNPGPGPENYVISETTTTSQSIVNLTIDNSGNVNCEVTDLNPGISFEIWCGVSLPTDGAVLNYGIINP